jgi:hypothetical protein
LGGGGGNVALSILRSWAFFFPALDFAFFPMIKQIGELWCCEYFIMSVCYLVLQSESRGWCVGEVSWTASHHHQRCQRISISETSSSLTSRRKSYPFHVESTWVEDRRGQWVLRQSKPRGVETRGCPGAVALHCSSSNIIWQTTTPE